MRYTEGYKDLQKQLHAAGGYGIGGYKHASQIISMCQQLGTRNVLDYGCGGQTLQKNMPFAITNYDPFIEGLDREPVPHDVVVCSDVLEHIEPDCLPDVLNHLRSLTRRILFVDIACRPAVKKLADGRNAHLIQWSPETWLTVLIPSFRLMSFQAYDGGFVAVLKPKEENP